MGLNECKKFKGNNMYRWHCNVCVLSFVVYYMSAVMDYLYQAIYKFLLADFFYSNVNDQNS